MDKFLRNALLEIFARFLLICVIIKVLKPFWSANYFLLGFDPIHKSSGESGWLWEVLWRKTSPFKASAPGDPITEFSQPKDIQLTKGSWSHIVLPQTHLSEMAGLFINRRWNSLLKTQLQWQLRDNSLERWSSVLLGAVSEIIAWWHLPYNQLT